MTSAHESALSVLRHGRDESVRPQDDLFGHVNGGWLATAEIPADLTSIGVDVDLALRAERQTAAVLRDAAEVVASGRAPIGSIDQKLGDLFSSFMDEEAVEERGVGPIADELDAIAAVQDFGAFAYLLGSLQRQGVEGVVGPWVHTDDRHSDRCIVYLTQGGLGLPDESVYRRADFAAIREAYLAHITRMLQLLGRAAGDAEAEASCIVRLESRLAAGHWDNVATRDVIAAYNPRRFEDLSGFAPNLDWAAWVAGLAAPALAFSEVVVRQPSFLSCVSETLASVSLSDWKSWLTWRTLHSAAPYLSSVFVEEHFAFYEGILRGAGRKEDRWMRAVSLANMALGEAVGQVYIARHFPPQAKAQIDVIVRHLIEAFRQSIQELDWMSPDTRSRALDKLAAINTKIGYPATWRDYSALRIDGADLMGNVRRAAAFEHDRQIAKAGRPVDRSEWLMNVQLVNASYNAGRNEICIPAAILGPPIFDPDADPAYNYGGIGSVIGHELGHAFDDKGARYDAAGNLHDWWTEQDGKRFQQRADQLMDQYNSFEPRALPGVRVNGSLTVGENIADLGGISMALTAYELSMAGEPAPVLDGWTGRQRLLASYALAWRMKERLELQREYLARDPHAPPEFRANVVRNLDEFHEAFDTRPGDGLWLNPEDRVHIWQ
jgi:putative endopeptidase